MRTTESKAAAAARIGAALGRRKLAELLERLRPCFAPDLGYVREGAGHALIGAREWIPAAQIGDPARSLGMGLPADLVFRTSFRLTLAGGVTLTCKQAAARLGHRRGWEIRSAGTGSKGQRWYAWAWLATASARHHLLIRRPLTTGDLAFCYCYLPEGQPASPPGRSAPQGCAGQPKKISSSARIASGSTSLRSACIPRSPGTPCWSWPPWASAPSPPPCSTAAPAPSRPPPPGSAAHWLDWRRRHQARSRWHHQRTRLARDAAIILVS